MKPTMRRAHAHLRERGSTYVLVLGAAMLVTLVGLSASATSRSHIRSSTLGREWNQANSSARSGLELGANVLGNWAGWRVKIPSNGQLGPMRMGNAELTLTYLDEVDGLLANNDVDPTRVFAKSVVGGATRYLSCVLTPTEREIAPFMRMAVHTGAGLSVAGTGTVTVSGAPASANGTASVGLGTTLDGGVEASIITNLGTITGETKAGASAKAVPNDLIWNDLSTTATTISFSSISGGVMEEVLLSAGSNPYGATNANGVYKIVVPTLQTLTIRNCRIEATLLVELAASSEMRTTTSVLWEPKSGGVALVVKSGLLSTCTLANSATALSEATIRANLNPSHTPYMGVSNSNRTDVYTPSLRGMFIMLGSGALTINSGATIRGMVVSEPAITLNAGSRIQFDRGLLASPPSWFLGALTFKPREGSMRWETEASYLAAVQAAAALGATTTGAGSSTTGTTSTGGSSTTSTGANNTGVTGTLTDTLDSVKLK